MTRRQEIIELLKKRIYTARELSLKFEAPISGMIEDLKHIAKTVSPEHKLVMELPKCNSCGFEFKGRRRISKPSKCPKCRGTDVEEPRFRIE